MPMPVRSTSAGSTPTHGPQDSLSGVGGDVQEAFAQGEFPGVCGELRGAGGRGWGLKAHTGLLPGFSSYFPLVLLALDDQIVCLRNQIYSVNKLCAGSFSVMGWSSMGGHRHMCEDDCSPGSELWTEGNALPFELCLLQRNWIE